MIQNQDGTPRATSLEAGHKPCAEETKKGDTVAARKRPGRNQREQFTDIASDKATEDGDWSEKDSDATSPTDGEGKEKATIVWKGQPGDQPGQLQKVGEDPTLANLSFLEGASASQETEVKYKKQVEQFLRFADEEKLAHVADDEIDAAIVLYLNMSHSRGRQVSDGEVVLRGSSSSNPSAGSWEGRALMAGENGLRHTQGDRCQE